MQPEVLEMLFGYSENSAGRLVRVLTLRCVWQPAVLRLFPPQRGCSVPGTVC